jgi:phosphoribosylaminoimidazole-succinocarboxamide synthase
MIVEGKTKVMYAVPGEASARGFPPSDLAIMAHKDAITAGDGAKRDVIAGKGVLSCRTTSAVYRHLDRCGVQTHYVDTLDERTMLVRRVAMIPIEWVARRVATGSYVRRTQVAEGTRFDPLILELFLKDDRRHDPLITAAEAVNMGLCTADDVDFGLRETVRVFEILEQAWADQDVELIDLKVEYGRDQSGRMLLADVIDNDSWRLWPGGKRDLMLDKQVYREMGEADAGGLEAVRLRYVEVAERVESFANKAPVT